MTNSQLENPALSLIERRDAVMAACADYLSAGSEDFEQLESLLDQLALLHGEQQEPTWALAGLPLPAGSRTLALLDIDDDGNDELLIASSTGQLDCYRWHSQQWERLATTHLPDEAGVVVGIAVETSLQDNVNIATVVTAQNHGRDADRLYELHLPTETELVVQEVLRSSRRGEWRRLALAQRSGPPAVDGMLTVEAGQRLGTRDYLLRAAPLLGKATEILLENRPVALAYTAYRVWIADSQERLHCWRWSNNQLLPDSAWPDNGIPVDGQISSLTLWPAPETGQWLLLAATDERWLFVADTSGNVLARFALPTTFLALAPHIDSNSLVALTEESTLRMATPIAAPFLAASLPEMHAWFTRLPADRRLLLLARWLDSPDAAETKMALQELIADNDSAATHSLLNHATGHIHSINQALPEIEGHALSGLQFDDPIVVNSLSLVESWCQRRDPLLQQRINRFTARLAAHFNALVRGSDDWRTLDQVRLRGDRNQADAFSAAGQAEQDSDALQAGLNYYAKMLLQRREEKWIFATNRAIRAIIPLPGRPQVLLATQDGQLYQLDLTTSRRVDSIQLPAGTLPRAVAVGSLAHQQPDKRVIALVTAQGHLYLGPATTDRHLTGLTYVTDVVDDSWSLALMPASDTKPAHLFIGGQDGRVTPFEQEPAGTWHQHPPYQTQADIIHSITLTQVKQDEGVRLLLGCEQAGGLGLFVIMQLDGAIDMQLTFDGAIRDIKTVPFFDRTQHLIAIMCADGYLRVVTPDGARRWEYRVGRAARNLSVFDIDGDGQPEIIVGGRDDTILILDAHGSVRWNIPTQAPITHVAATRSVEGHPLLLIGDLENTLQVVQVNPPGSPQEVTLDKLAAESLSALAELSATTVDEKLLAWTENAPTQFLRGYAFYACASAIGQARQLDVALLTADISFAVPVEQRAYARALARAATQEPYNQALTERIVEHLVVLMQDERTRWQVGLAAMRVLKQPNRLNAAGLSTWQPVLLEAAAHPRADVQRAVLYILRTMRPFQMNGINLLPEAWEILRTILRSKSDDDAWVLRDMAGLIRDLAATSDRLWTLIHFALTELPDASLLTLLGQTEQRMLDSYVLPPAVAAINALRQETTIEEVGRALGHICEAFAWELPAASSAISQPNSQSAATEPLALFYGGLAEAARCTEVSEWLRFVDDRRRGMQYLQRQLEQVGKSKGGSRLLGRSLMQHLSHVRAAIDALLAEPSRHPDRVRHLIGQLRREADLLLSISEDVGPAGLTNGSLPHSSVLHKAVAGLLFIWLRPQGVLSEWYEALTRPAEPVLDIINARLQRTELTLTLNIHNPSHAETVNELSLFVSEAKLLIAPIELSCHPDARSQIDGLNLDPQETIQIRLQATLTPEQLAQFRQSNNRVGTLSLPLYYFQPPKHWLNPTVISEFGVQYSRSVAVDWSHDMPTAWTRIEQEIWQAIALSKADDSYQPLSIICPPFGRDSLIDRVQHMSTQSTPPPVIDLRQWLFALHELKNEGLRIDESTWLAWLASQMWPEADSKLIQHIRHEGAPRHFFGSVAETQRDVKPASIIINNWESLLFVLAHDTTDNWTPFDQTLPFLLSWAKQSKTQLIFVGTTLADEIMRQRWPAVHPQLRHIQTDKPQDDDEKLRRDTVRTFSRIVDELELASIFSRFAPATSSKELVQLAGGSLHILDLLILPGLRALRGDATRQPGSAQEYFLEFANSINFFNTFWMWQPFYERLTMVLVAHGEIPLQDRTWAEAGLTLSRDYYARTKDRNLVRLKTLPAGLNLTQREAVTIRANRFYMPGDAYVRGLSPQRPAVPDWKIAGEMFLSLLRAGNGDRLLQRLVDDGVLQRNKTRFLGDYYQVSIPIYAAWLQQADIWKQMLAAANSAQNSWYPPRLAVDQRADSNRYRQLLFPSRRSGAAYRDIPLSQLQSIQWGLNNRTLPLFLNMYGLNGRGVVDAQSRWQGLVTLATALDEWEKASLEDAITQEKARRLYSSLHTLLQFNYIGNATGAEFHIPLHAVPAEGGQIIAGAEVSFGSHASVLRKEALLLVVRDGASLATHARELRLWARTWLNKMHRSQQEDEQRDHVEIAKAMERSVVIVVALSGADELRRTRLSSGGGPHFVFVDVPKLTEIVIAQDPPDAMISYALDNTGRSAFTPYKLRGSLAGGSRLFVGRETELNAILSSLSTEDHAILGSRRIGKTSLLFEIAHRIKQPDFGRNILTLIIRLQDQSTIANFYSQVKWQLEEHGHEKLARRLADKPGNNYHDLHEVMATLARQYQHPVVLLIDEVDGLYLRDRDKNEEHFFQFLRNQLAQSEPRICTFILTGFRYIYLSRLEHDSVFYNFCRFHSLLGVDKAAVASLVDLLEDFKITLDQKEEVLGLITQGTYAIPYYVQRVCDNLLSHVDRIDQNVIGPAEVQLALEQDIQTLLKQELWDKLSVSSLLWRSDGDREQELKTKIALLATILSMYEHKFNPELAHISLADGHRSFVEADVILFLEDWAPELFPETWQVSELEINRLLRSLTMTLAIAPADEDRRAFVFPNHILPDVLCFHHRREDADLDLLTELSNMVQELKQMK